MRNLDSIKAERNAVLTNLLAAMKADDKDAFSNAMASLAANVSEEVRAEYEMYMQSADVTALAARGMKPLTTKEVKFFTDLSQAFRSSNPKQALENIESTVPPTFIDRVMDDIVQEHPLLEAVDLVNTGLLTKFIINTDGGDAAVWGNLTDEITKEIASGFDVVDMTLLKLTGFIPVPMAMVDLGPEWLERYVRAVLVEAIAIGLEDGIVNGDGNKQPIGMNRDVSEDVTVSGGVYPEKATVAVTKLDPKGYGAVLAMLAKTPSGKKRAIRDLVFVCNPEDYFTKVMPATTMMVPAGGYMRDVLPYPTKIIQSVAVPAGKAIVGIGKGYFMGVGTGGNTAGKIEYSDEFKFLEDMRTYKVKLYGNGRPKDDNCFVYLDISGLEELVYKVEQVGA